MEQQAHDVLEVNYTCWAPKIEAGAGLTRVATTETRSFIVVAIFVNGPHNEYSVAVLTLVN
jgi:hypothetical protein